LDLQIGFGCLNLQVISGDALNKRLHLKKIGFQQPVYFAPAIALYFNGVFEPKSYFLPYIFLGYFKAISN
jgi:hypothetical protein